MLKYCWCGTFHGGGQQPLPAVCRRASGEVGQPNACTRQSGRFFARGTAVAMSLPTSSPSSGRSWWMEAM
jgi:hypothetical protein